MQVAQCCSGSNVCGSSMTTSPYIPMLGSKELYSYGYAGNARVSIREQE